MSWPLNPDLFSPLIRIHYSHFFFLYHTHTRWLPICHPPLSRQNNNNNFAKGKHIRTRVCLRPRGVQQVDESAIISDLSAWRGGTWIQVTNTLAACYTRVNFHPPLTPCPPPHTPRPPPEVDSIQFRFRFRLGMYHLHGRKPNCPERLLADVGE